MNLYICAACAEFQTCMPSLKLRFLHTGSCFINYVMT